MSTDARRTVTVLGIGADGWAGLGPTGRTRVEHSAVVLGSPRQLSLLPEVEGQVRLVLPSPLLPDLGDLVATHAEAGLVVLASGDPLSWGIGGTLVGMLGDRLDDRLEVLPAVSSVALARARMGWSEATCTVLRVTRRRDVDALHRELAPGRRLLVLSADDTTPREIADLLVAAGYGASVLTVLGDLGAADETSRCGTAADAGEWLGGVPPLNLVAVAADGPVVGSWASGLPDDAFEHDGQLTKRDLRASALSRLRPQPDQVLWDVGAGAGSVGIEWLRAHPACHAVAVEADAGRVERITRNAGRLGVPRLVVHHGRAPEALEELEAAPDAVFVGGGATTPGLLEACTARLRPGGRLVVHGVTLQTEVRLAEAHADLGGELTRISVEHAAPIGSFTGWTPARAVTQWAWSKP